MRTLLALSIAAVVAGSPFVATPPAWSLSMPEPAEQDGIEPEVAVRGRLSAPFDLDFTGGSALAYVEAVSKASGYPNISASPRLREIELPAITLRSVDVETALHLLGTIDREGQSGVRAEAELIDNGSTAPIFVVQAFETSGRGRRSQTDMTVVSLREIIDTGFEPDDVIAAIEAALDVATEDGVPQPVVRFHEPTGLLLVRGTIPQLEAIQGVAATLRNSVAIDRDRIDRDQALIRERQEAQRLAAQAAELEAVAAAAKDERRQMQVELEAALRAAQNRERDMQEVRGLAEHRVQEAAELRVQLEAARRELESLAAEAQALRNRVRELEAGRRPSGGGSGEARP